MRSIRVRARSAPPAGCCVLAGYRGGCRSTVPWSYLSEMCSRFQPERATDGEPVRLSEFARKPARSAPVDRGGFGVVVLDALGREFRQAALDLLPDLSHRDHEHALPPLHEVEDLVGVRAFGHPHAVAHQD